MDFTLHPTCGPLVKVIVENPEYAPAADAPFSAPPSQEPTALVDSGCSRTCIDAWAITTLGLREVGRTDVNYGGGAGGETPLYRVNLTIGRFTLKGIVVGRTEVAAESMEGVNWGGRAVATRPFQALIGRDVLRHGTFIYQGREGTFRLDLPEGAFQA